MCLCDDRKGFFPVAQMWMLFSRRCSGSLPHPPRPPVSALIGWCFIYVTLTRLDIEHARYPVRVCSCITIQARQADDWLTPIWGRIVEDCPKPVSERLIVPKSFSVRLKTTCVQEFYVNPLSLNTAAMGHELPEHCVFQAN